MSACGTGDGKWEMEEDSEHRDAGRPKYDVTSRFLISLRAFCFAHHFVRLSVASLESGEISLEQAGDF